MGTGLGMEKEHGSETMTLQFDGIVLRWLVKTSWLHRKSLAWKKRLEKTY